MNDRFTITDFSEVPIPWDPEWMSFLCYQQETCPNTNTLHWQTYLETKTRKRFSTIQNHLSGQSKPPYIVKSDGTAAQNQKYCSKSETSTPGSFISFGEARAPLAQGTRTDINDTLNRIVNSSVTYDELILEDPTRIKHSRRFLELITVRDRRDSKRLREINVVYLYGPPGCGKSHWAYTTYPDAHRLSIIPGDKLWFDGYQRNDVLILEDLEPGALSRTQLLSLLDKYPLTVNVKTTTTQAFWTTVVITSNYLPEQICPGEAFQRRVNTLVNYNLPVTNY